MGIGKCRNWILHGNLHGPHCTDTIETVSARPGKLECVSPEHLEILGNADVFLPTRNTKTWKRARVKNVFSQGYHHPPYMDMVNGVYS